MKSLAARVPCFMMPSVVFAPPLTSSRLPILSKLLLLASPQEPPKADIAGYDADDFMSGGFMSALGDDHGSGEPATNGIVDDGMVDDGDDDDEEDDDDDNNESDDSGDEDANANAMDLKGLAETDPEFFDFLQVRASI